MGKSCEQLLPPSEALPGIGEHCVVFHNGKGFYYTCREYSTSFEKRQFKCVRAECGVTATMGPELGSPLQDDGSHTHPADWGYRDKCLLLQTIKERFLRDNSSASLILQEILSSLIFESEEDNEASCNFESITIEEQTPLNLFKVEPCLLDPIDENNELEEEMDKLSTTLPPTARTYGRTRSKEKRLIKLSPTHEENEEEEEEVQRPDFVAVPGADELCSRLGTPEDALADMDYEIEETKLNRKRKQMTCEREESPSKQVGDVRNTNKKGRPSQFQDISRLNGKLHLPYPLEGRKVKDCVVCSSRAQGGTRKRVKFCCKTCENEPGLHIGVCFEKYHSSQIFQQQDYN
ncbi:uncharacterized protein LOC124366957 isoform X5 [Homalodisca vitripennis]|uniref:uncharacterized protein LOC124366957 isoform X5 n=1 Tax=Homalodisca vitripennis TaxID=197043 RepID=UPI001EEBFF78|nr:uncharacterized protein LOC124366957 isoform X5 [Homalodisca vitripennis]